MLLFLTLQVYEIYDYHSTNSRIPLPYKDFCGFSGKSPLPIDIEQSITRDLKDR